MPCPSLQTQTKRDIRVDMSAHTELDRESKHVEFNFEMHVSYRKDS